MGRPRPVPSLRFRIPIGFFSGRIRAVTFLTFLLLILSVTAYVLFGDSVDSKRGFPEGGLFNSAFGFPGGFQMEGVAISSCRGNGKRLTLKADGIECKPLKRWGITFVNYAQLIVRNARVEISVDANTPGSSQDANTDTGSSQDANTDTGFGAGELFNIFSQLAGGSRKFILSKSDLENGPANARVIVQVTAFPLAMEFRTDRNHRMKIRAGQARAGIGKREVVLSGGASVNLSDQQILRCKKIRCLGSFQGFFAEGAYVFETDGHRLTGKNGFFEVANGRMGLSKKEYGRTAGNTPSDPMQFIDAVFAGPMARMGKSRSFRLFSQLFMGPFHPGSTFAQDESSVLLSK